MKSHPNHLKKLQKKIKKVVQWIKDNPTIDQEQLIQGQVESMAKEEKVKDPNKIYQISVATAPQLFEAMNKCLVCHTLFAKNSRSEENCIYAKCQCGCSLTIETGTSFILILMEINKGKDMLIGEVYKNLFNKEDGTFETTIKMRDEEIYTDEVMYHRFSNSALETITNFTKKMDEILVLL